MKHLLNLMKQKLGKFFPPRGKQLPPHVRNLKLNMKLIKLHILNATPGMQEDDFRN